MVLLIAGTLCIWDTTPHHPTEFNFTLLHDLALLTESELLTAKHLI